MKPPLRTIKTYCTACGVAVTGRSEGECAQRLREHQCQKVKPLLRGLTAYEWYGGYCDLVARWLCGLRGHPWGQWYLEAEEMPYGPATRMCDRCAAYEEKS